MGIRQKLQESRGLSVVLSVGFLVLAAAIVAYQFWPEKKANLEQHWYTDDDGAHWFADSAFLVPPFEHDGRTAVTALIFSYANGTKQYCAWEAKYTEEGKKQLDAALADAKAKGQPASSVSLLTDRDFEDSNLLIKLPGKGDWVPAKQGEQVRAKGMIAPDGGRPTDQVLVY